MKTRLLNTLSTEKVGLRIFWILVVDTYLTLGLWVWTALASNPVVFLCLGVSLAVSFFGCILYSAHRGLSLRRKEVWLTEGKYTFMLNLGALPLGFGLVGGLFCILVEAWKGLLIAAPALALGLVMFIPALVRLMRFRREQMENQK